MMVSSRLSFCTRTPVGKTPMIATSAIAMTPRHNAISTIVNAASFPADAGRGFIVPCVAGSGVLESTFMSHPSKPGAGRLVHAGPTGQPVDANPVVCVVVGGLHHHVWNRKVSTVSALEKDAAFRQRDQRVMEFSIEGLRNHLPLRIKGDVGERPKRHWLGC